jgi:hypothetical protein
MITIPANLKKLYCQFLGDSGFWNKNLTKLLKHIPKKANVEAITPFPYQYSNLAYHAFLPNIPFRINFKTPNPNRIKNEM